MNAESKNERCNVCACSGDCPGGCTWDGDNCFHDAWVCSRCSCDIYFEVPGRPWPKERPRFVPRRTRAGKQIMRAITPEGTSAAEQLICGVANKFRPKEKLAGPVGVDLIFWTLPPKDLRAAERERISAGGWIYSDKKPDIDNLAKLVLDGLQLSGFFAVGDSQVAGLQSTRVYAARPRTTVRIWRL